MTDEHIRAVQTQGADKDTLAAMRKDNEQKTFSVQSLIGQRERLKQFIDIVGQIVDPENIRDVMRVALSTKSQFMQEAFAFAFANGRRDGFFVEFGACDGLHLTNTWLLETEYGWRGILSEPARIWAKALRTNRTAAAIDLRCVWSQTGATVEFWEAKRAGMSSIVEPEGDDDPIAEHYSVETVSLVDLLRAYDAPAYVDFLSIDTEGTEYDILAAFDFERYRFGFISVEQHELDDDDITTLLRSRGYEPLFPRVPNLSKWSHASGFDVWYVPREVHAGLRLRAFYE